MGLTKRNKILIGAASIAGVAGLMGGAAFTATGLATSGQAAAPQFVGGTVTQSVTGATLTDVVYGYTDATNTSVNGVTLTFASGANGRSVSVVFNGAGSPLSCGTIASNSATCTPAAPLSVDNIAVTVA